MSAAAIAQGQQQQPGSSSSMSAAATTRTPRRYQVLEKKSIDIEQIQGKSLVLPLMLGYYTLTSFVSQSLNLQRESNLGTN